MSTDLAAERETETNALYLPRVEREPQPGIYGDLIESARRQGSEYSKIWELFAFQESFTCALFNFYNRWIIATGAPEMPTEAHRRQEQMLAEQGYIRKEGE